MALSPRLAGGAAAADAAGLSAVSQQTSAYLASLEPRVRRVCRIWCRTAQRAPSAFKPKTRSTAVASFPSHAATARPRRNAPDATADVNLKELCTTPELRPLRSRSGRVCSPSRRSHPSESGVDFPGRMGVTSSAGFGQFPHRGRNQAPQRRCGGASPAEPWSGLSQPIRLSELVWQ